MPKVQEMEEEKSISNIKHILYGRDPKKAK